LTAIVVACSTPAKADVIRILDFEKDANSNPIVAGQIIDDEYAAWGLNIQFENLHKNFHLGIAFDSHDATGGDSDLTSPWSGGNAQSEDFGNALIISERNTDSNGDQIIDVPDDEGGRPAGTMSFLFDDPIDEIDVLRPCPGRWVDRLGESYRQPDSTHIRQ
jgi:hypothetical protein